MGERGVAAGERDPQGRRRVFRPGDRPSPDKAEQAIDHLRDGFGVDPVCRVPDLSPSTCFAREQRPKSARRLRGGQLMPLIVQVHDESGATYGARRITRALHRKGVGVARCTAGRLVAELGIEGVIRGRRRRTTVPERAAPRPPDLVGRDFSAERPGRLWVADVTHVRTWSGWVYVAFVLDVFSRTIVDCQVADHMRTELTSDAPEMALWWRRIKEGSGLMHHSDRGRNTCPFATPTGSPRSVPPHRSDPSPTRTKPRWPRP
ncbi:IS3 family transposase [Kitasatospora sp. NPDC090308]|uniref:IS3 family transposase n=1 Tax=Kitasatospora sp. NPDC090308 TaxID=3364082 RepID=UPI003802F383